MENASQSRPKFGVILSGGISLGLAYIGVHRAMWEAGLKPAAIGGCSVGAAMGALWAAGLTPYEMEKATAQASWPGLVGLRRSTLGLFSLHKLAQRVEAVCGHNFLEDLPIPLSVFATDIATGEGITLSKGRLGEAVTASCAIPGVFAPVNIGDLTLVDGGVRQNLPTGILNERTDIQFVFAVDPIRKLALMEKPKNPVSSMLQAFLIQLRVQSEFAPTGCRKPLIVSSPLLVGVNALDLAQLDMLQRLGYESTMDAIERCRDWFETGPPEDSSVVVLD
jgi:predicted acylesterase/phospholipase RssA